MTKWAVYFYNAESPAGYVWADNKADALDAARREYGEDVYVLKAEYA